MENYKAKYGKRKNVTGKICQTLKRQKVKTL